MDWKAAIDDLWADEYEALLVEQAARARQEEAAHRQRLHDEHTVRARLDVRDDKETLLSQYQCALNGCKVLVYGDKATDVKIWPCQLQEHLCPLLKIFGIVGFVFRFALRIVSSVASKAFYFMALFIIFNRNMIPGATLARFWISLPLSGAPDTFLAVLCQHGRPRCRTSG